MIPVLAMLALGSLVIVPSLSYHSTNLKTTVNFERRAEGLYAADAGVEHALWTLKYNEPLIFPHVYNLTDINGMSVNITISRVTVIAGQDVTESGVHGGWMTISKTVTYSAGVYYYTLSVENNGAGNMKVDEILIDLPPDLEYIPGSTSGMTDDSTLEIVGNSGTGITLVWQFPEYTLGINETGYHYFQLSGDPDVEGVEGHTFVRATREDVGVVWDADSKPYNILSEAVDAGGITVATIKAGVWRATGGYMEVACWQLNP